MSDDNETSSGFDLKQFATDIGVFLLFLVAVQIVVWVVVFTVYGVQAIEFPSERDEPSQFEHCKVLRGLDKSDLTSPSDVTIECWDPS